MSEWVWIIGGIIRTGEICLLSAKLVLVPLVDHAATKKELLNKLRNNLWCKIIAIVLHLLKPRVHVFYVPFVVDTRRYAAEKKNGACTLF